MDEPLGSVCSMDAESSPGLNVVGDFVLMQRLGEGSYGSVFQGVHKRTKKLYAIKQVDLSGIGDQDLKRIRHEGQMMQGLHHPNVTRFYQILHTSTAYYFVMELAEGGELFDKVIAANHFSEQQTRKYFQQLVSAIYYCHDQGITHGDLKAENLLLDKDGRLKICDFGLSRCVWEEEDDAGLGGMVGTTNYMAPELFDAAQAGYDSEGGNKTDPFRADLYASGVILFFMLTGNLPFGAEGEGEDEVEYNIRHGQYDESKLTTAEALLMQGLLEPDPKKRYTLTDILADPWFLVNIKPDLFPQGRIKMNGNERGFCEFKKREDSSSPEASSTPEENVTEEEEEVLRTAFDKIDIDHNGDKISKDELRDCLISLTHGSSVSQDELNSLTEQFHPADSDSGITFAEFKSAWINRDLAHCDSKFARVFQLNTISKLGHEFCPAEKTIMKELRSAFNTLDEAHVGLIDHRNLRQVFEKAGVQISEAEALSLIHAMSSLNHNNQVSFDEFVNAIAHEDILVKHPVGRRLASAANLNGYANMQEFEELVSHGMTVGGDVEETVEKIHGHNQLIHIGQCADGVCTTNVLGPIITGPTPMPDPPPRVHVSPAMELLSPADAHLGVMSPSSAVAVGPCKMSPGAENEFAVHTFQYAKEPSSMGESGVGRTGHTPKAQSPQYTPRTGSPQQTPIDPSGLAGVILDPPNVLVLTPQRRQHNTPCTVDVKLRGAACAGYTSVKVTRISGSTKDFHEVVKLIGIALQAARDQALEDSSPVDDGELM